MQRQDKINLLLETFAAALQPPPDILLSEWADKYRVLSPEASARRGQWKTLPYQKEPLDVLSPKHPCQIAVYKCASQIMKTELLLTLLGFVIHLDPGPALFVEPRSDDAKALSKDRVAPMLRDTPCLNGRVAAARSRDADNATLHKSFVGGHVTFTGAISPSGLAMRPIRYLFLDEVARYPKSAGMEGSPISLAIRRTDTFDLNKKIAIASSPTDPDSAIEQWWQASDQRKFHVPCPFCGEYQVLVFSQLKWDVKTRKMGEPLEAEYECAHCQKRIPHYRKAWMNSQGRYIAENPTSRIPGFHLTQLNSAYRSWGQIAEEFLEAKKSDPALKTFINTVLAEEWKEKGEAPDWKRLYDRRDKTYTIGTVPRGALFLTAGADVQQDRIEVSVIGWGRGEQSWLVDYIVLYGDPGRGEVWDDLTKILGTVYRHEGGADMRIRKLAIDSGYNTQAVYRWARNHKFGPVEVVKGGSDMQSAPLSQPSPVEITVAGQRLASGVKVTTINVGHFKSELYGWLRLDLPAENEEYPDGFFHFCEVSDTEEYCKQLTAEQLVVRYSRGGHEHREWQKVRPRNEALDTWVYARAAAVRLRISSYREDQWRELEESLGVRMKAEPPPLESDRVNAPSPQQRTLGNRRRMIAPPTW